LIEEAKNWKPYDAYDDYRHEGSYKDGGFPLNDQVVVTNLRNAFKSMMKQVGRQIISGKFNLANTTFPIWCMAPKSIL